MDFSIRHIEKIIVHQLIRSEDGKNFGVNYSDYLIENLDEIKDQVRIKLGELIPKSMVMDIRSDGEIFSIAKKIPKMKNKDFIETSKRVADRLARSQAPTAAKRGALTVIYAKNKIGQNIVVFVKSEFEKGIETKLARTKDIVTMKLLNNIIFTQTTHYYKIGAFLCGKDDEWVSVLYDNLATKYAKEKATKYFYDSFLEVSFREQDEDLVFNFYKHTKTFIEEKYSGSELLDKMTHLSSYLKSPNNLHVNSTKFGQDYMQENIQDYTAFMKEQKIPTRNILKNPEMIEKRLKYRILRFQDGININIPSDKFKDNFILIDPKDLKAERLNKEGWTFIAIKGTITSEK